MELSSRQHTKMFNLLAVTMLFVAVALGDDTLSDRGAMKYPVLPVRNVRAINGISRDISDVPWLVAIGQSILNATGNYIKLTCGGSIISEYWVLTAAHCLFHANRTEKPVNRVFAGATDFIVGSVHPINRKIHHPFWKHIPDIGVSVNDLGLINLKQRFHYGKNCKSIPLYDRPMNTLENSVVTASGQGYDGNKDYSSRNIKVISLEILPTRQCEELISNNFNFTLPTSQICGSGLTLSPGRKMSTCWGDSGGPVISNQTLVAIVSWGFAHCNSDQKPNILTEVAPYRGWILNQIG